MGADFYCLHKNRWWQTSRGPLLDAGAFVAGLEYATGVEATVVGKPSPTYFAAALDALGAEPELTWLVGDDAESDVRAAQLFGMRTALVRTGKFRPDTLERLDVTPDVVLSSVADLPGLARASRLSRAADGDPHRHRPHRDRPDPAGPRPTRVPRPLLHGRPSRRTARRAGTRPSRYAARFCGKEAVGKALGCGVLFTWKEIEIVGPPKPGVTLSGRTLALRRARRDAGHRRLAHPLAHDGRGDVRRRPRRSAPAGARRRVGTSVYEPLYTADEMRAVEARYPGYPEHRRRADGACGRCGRRRGDPRLPRAHAASPSSAARARTAATGGSPRACSARRARRGRDGRAPGADVVVDALFGTGFHGAPRQDAAALIERIKASGRRCCPSTCPPASTPRPARPPAAAVTADVTVTFHGAEARARRRTGTVPRRAVVVADIGLDPATTAIVRATPAVLSLVPAPRLPRLEVHGRLARSSSEARRARPARRCSRRPRRFARTPAT